MGPPRTHPHTSLPVPGPKVHKGQEMPKTRTGGRDRRGKPAIASLGVGVWGQKCSEEGSPCSCSCSSGRKMPQPEGEHPAPRAHSPSSASFQGASQLHRRKQTKRGDAGHADWKRERSWTGEWGTPPPRPVNPVGHVRRGHPLSRAARCASPVDRPPDEVRTVRGLHELARPTVPGHVFLFPCDPGYPQP